MKSEHQVYDCDKPNCFYCKIMVKKVHYLPGIARRIIWTPKQIEYLVTNWNLKGRLEMALDLNICKDVIQKKAKELDLGVKKKIYLSTTHMEESRLNDNFGGWY